MQSTMQDFPLTITHLLRHGQTVHGRSQVATFDGAGYGGLRLARSPSGPNGLPPLCAGGNRRRRPRRHVLLEHQEHLEAYLAVPCMGAVLHTLNIRLFPEQLVYIINHAEDRVHHRGRLVGPAAGADCGRADHGASTTS